MVAPANWTAAPNVTLYFSDTASVALDVGSDPLNFGDLLRHLLPDAFQVLLSSILSPLRLLGVFTSYFAPCALAVQHDRPTRE